MSNFLNFFTVQRQIFGHCEQCYNFFRLSDCRISQKNKQKNDWLDDLRKAELCVEKSEERLWAREHNIREKARNTGRREAQKLVKRVDRIFAPLKLAAQDAKPLFNPVSYIVVEGMHKFNYKSLTFLDTKKSIDRGIQRSIKRCVEQKKIDWTTVRVDKSGELSIQ